MTYRMTPSPHIIAKGLCFVVVSALILYFGRRAGRKSQSMFGAFALLFSVLWTALVAVGMSRDFQRARSARSSGEYTVVQGKVEHFVPQPYAGHAYETFTVNGTDFSYTDYKTGAGFHQSRSHGGPITNGVRVRIGHARGEILTLEVCP
jgi:hypothetical protein